MSAESEYELRRNLAISLSNAEMALSRSEETAGRGEVRRAYRACHRLTASISGKSVNDFPEDAVVVSDSQAFRENVTNILGMSGCETETVSRFEEARPLVADRDLVLTDLLVSGTLVTDTDGFEDAVVVSVFEEDGVPYQAVSGVVTDADETGYDEVAPVGDVHKTETDADAYFVTEEELRENGYDVLRDVRGTGRGRVPVPVYLVSDAEVSIVGGEEFRRKPLNMTDLLSSVLAAR